MKKTPLYNSHINQGAKMINFADWFMPLQYKNGIISEVKSVRNSVGMFDVSHMGRIKFTKAKSLEILEKLISINIHKLKSGRAKYNLICNESGKIIDDAIISNVNDENFYLVVNAINTQKVIDWFKKFGAKNNMSDITYDTSMIALQGPNSLKIINRFSKNSLILKKFGIIETNLFNIKCILSRTGYTGEDGVEIICNNNSATDLWNNLIDNNVTPCGLASRDVLRIEAGLPLYGNELTEEISPNESGLEKFANTNSEIYLVKKKIRDLKPKKRLLGIKLTEKGIPRKNQKILDPVNNKIIGEITSGTFSPTINSGIALGYLNSEYLTDYKNIIVDIRGKNTKGKIIDIPFVKSKPLK